MNGNPGTDTHDHSPREDASAVPDDNRGDDNPDDNPDDGQLTLLAADAVPVIDPVKMVFDAYLETRREFARETAAPEDLPRKLTGVAHVKLDDKRRKLISKAIEGYGVDYVIQAVQGWLYSDWHRGRNERAKIFNGLELILRDAGKIEQFYGYYQDRDLQPVGAGSPIGNFDPANDGVIQL